ncbi:phosphodiester glycosidase family protein [Microseira sp. BLCC-F43]|jgi:exopolysaccharide biosynthesis protein|uniref:phosphodiester glycosidase family protein n=1 Tax=Microseira sp. BLCC-F43 TaxID=3153602 RepID=UPI0035B9E2FE
MLHIVSIDLNATGIGVLVTPGKPMPQYGESRARTTSELVKEFKLQLAINANYFGPFREEHPWDFYPHSGDKTNVIGQAISQGFVYSPPRAGWPVLCFDTNNRAQIVESGRCPDGTLQAVAGIDMLVSGGKTVKSDASDGEKPYGRVAVAVGKKLWLIAVDGKQPHYSEGVTLAELSEIIVNLGAETALNLDGGGSTTMVVSDRKGIRGLNAPIHTKLPMRERPVANHLGFYVRKNPRAALTLPARKI